MDQRYQPALYETTIYQLWLDSGAFRPRSDFKTTKSSSAEGSASNTDSKKTKTQKGSTKQDLPSPYPAGVGTNKAFSIILPPPNANDSLHVGHAMYTVEDVLIRYHRMLGDNTLWLPGTDHAGIETQYVFEKKLQKQGKSRFQYDRSSLYQEIWQYVQENSNVATDQLQKLGFSLDWSRFRFTLDPKVVEFVTETFFNLHKDGLIYRDLQLVNYCPKCGTSYSDLEVEYVERTDPLYYITYGPLTVATVRPETKLGDVALAVHPKDKRFAKYVGTTIKIQDVSGEIELPVIADDFVDKDFGTGVLKVTPAHDPNDFLIGKKHNLPTKQVISTRGKMTDDTGPFANMSVAAARTAIVTKLTELGLIDHVDENYTHSVATCYRCGHTIEPLPLPQFFLKVKDAKKNLVADVLKSLDTKQTVIHGPGREAILRNWLDNLVDWNISRQIVWGIPIPVWYQVTGYEKDITVTFVDDAKAVQTGLLADFLPNTSLEKISQGLQNLSAAASVPYKASKTKPQTNEDWIPETDTFDTWFSSSQWPVVTLKTGQTTDFEQFYPTSVMETAYDILLFWVMRMMLLGIYLTGTTPFSQVYLHGLIRDGKGQKMSKSKGNVVNPLSVAEVYGADALRLALVIRSTPAQDKSVGEPDFKAARNLTNKLWNAARYVLTTTDASQVPNVATKSSNPNNETKKTSTNTQTSELFDQKLAEVVTEVTQHLELLRPGQAADTVVNQFWHWYCDECIEAHKQGQLSRDQLVQGLLTFLKLLHPFVPFITEQLWQECVAQQLIPPSLLITTSWPSPTTPKRVQ